MPRYQFMLHISPQELLRYYRGDALHVVVRCRTGETLQFPATALQRHVTEEGVHGRFELTCDDQNKFVSLERRRHG